MNRVFGFLLMLFSIEGASQSSTNMDSLKFRANYRINTFLDHDHSLGGYYRIDDNGVTIYSSPRSITGNSVRDTSASMSRPEYFLGWNEVEIFEKLLKMYPKDSVIRILQAKGTGEFPQWIRDGFQPAMVLTPAKDPSKPFQGMRIALDPGHIAGDTAFARVEERFIHFKVKALPAGLDTSLYHVEHVGDSVEIHLSEGMMASMVAADLADWLRQRGANVLVTHQPGVSAFGKTFAQWKKDDYPRTLDSLLKIDPTNKNLLKLKKGIKSDDRFIFRFVFFNVEMKKRAEVINAFHPDLTVIIHFNVDEKNTDWLKPTDKNFCMAFVGGSFLTGELSDSLRRFDFLRLMLTDDLPNSIEASGYAAVCFQKYLDVPLATKNDATYLQKSCMETFHKGVFCRDLSLTRTVEGTIIYGETLYQDNYLECLKLSAYNDIEIEAWPEHLFVYQRLTEVSLAYKQALLEWAANNDH